MRAFDTISENSDTENYTTWQVMQEYLPRELLTEYRKAFSLFDTKTTGLIQLNDITKVLKNMGWNVSLQKIEDVLREIVGSECGKTPADYADFQEYIAIMSVVATNCVPEDEMYRVFQHFDCDGDGYISPKELGELLLRIGDEFGEEDIQEMMQAADCDGDGKVSYEEFVRVMTNSSESSSSDGASVSSTDISTSCSDFAFDEEVSDWSYTTSVSNLDQDDCVDQSSYSECTREPNKKEKGTTSLSVLTISRQLKSLCSGKRRKLSGRKLGKLLKVNSFCNKIFRRLVGKKFQLNSTS